MDPTRARFEEDFAPLLRLLSLHGKEPELDRGRQVYANRDLNLHEIDVVGFDMDYTLALYQQEALDALSVEKTLERMVETRGYPRSVYKIEPRHDFAIRGLVVDKERGDILKLDAGRHVLKARHGFEEILAEGLYLRDRPPIRLNTPRYHLIDTLFALPEAFLYAALVDHFQRAGEAPPNGLAGLFEDIRRCIDLAHRDGSLKAVITADVGAYVQRDDKLGLTLRRLRESGKKLFVLTNSDLAYTERVMGWLLGEAWRESFDLVITEAAKPSFFSGSQPFLALDEAGGVAGVAQEALEPGTIYKGGNLHDFGALTGWASHRVLYVGDHIYGDILKSKKSSSWHTCMILQELPREIKCAEELRGRLELSRQLEAELVDLSDQLLYKHQTLHHVEELLGPRSLGDLGPEILQQLHQAHEGLAVVAGRLGERRREIIQRLRGLDHEVESHSNPYWGLTLKAGNEQTLFASQVELYADLYTSAVHNLLSYPPNPMFRAPRPVMPHER